MSKTAKIRIEKPKTKRGERILRQREPQEVETVRKILLLYGSKTSQIVKDVLSDLYALRRGDASKFTRKNADILPFEAGGEVALEHFADKTQSGQFVLGSHSKKRPHNLVLGRLHDGRLYDLLELGVEQYTSLSQFRAAAARVQAQNKPCFVFCGEQFEHDADFRQAKSMLLDLFRGQVAQGIDLLGLDHVIYVTALGRTLIFRQYVINLKKSGTKVPRIELAEMGPRIDFSLRRCRAANADVEKLAMRQPKLSKKKEKNVSTSSLDGKIGRIYMPKQQIMAMPQHKMKGLKRSLDNADDAPAAKRSVARPARAAKTN